MAISDLPTGALYSESGEPIGSVADGYEAKMRYWQNAAYEEAVRTRKLSPEEDRIQTYRKWLQGEQTPKDRPRYRSRFYLNKVEKARRDSLALLTDARPDIEVDSRIKEYDPQSDVIDRALRAEWMRKDMDLDLVSAVDISGVCGTSFWKIDGSAPGSLSVTPLGPDCVMPIQPGRHIQQSTAVLYRTWKSLNEIIRRFPFRAADLEKEASSWSFQTQNGYARPDNMDIHTWNGLAPQMQRMVGKRASTDEAPSQGVFKSVEVQEFWVDDPSINESPNTVVMRDPYKPLDAHNWWYKVAPGQRLYPRKRLIIFAGHRLIYDGPSPYWHGLYPFACLRLNPVFWSFWGLSKYRDLLPVNAAINDIVAGILDLVKRALNPQMIARQQSITKASWDMFFPDLPGGKLLLQGPQANPANDVQYSKPPELPTYVSQLLVQFLGPEFDKHAGIIDIAAMSRKNQVPGGDTIEQMRDSLQTSLRLEGRYIEAFLKDAGIQAVSHIIQFYTAAQRLKLLGPDGITLEDFDYNPGMLAPSEGNDYEHYKNFMINVVPGSLHGGSKDRSKMLYINLFGQGAISNHALLEKLEIPNGDQIIKQRVEEMQQLAAAQAPQQADPAQALMGILAGAAQGGGGAEPPTPAPSGPGVPIRMTRGQRNGNPV